MQLAKTLGSVTSQHRNNFFTSVNNLWGPKVSTLPRHDANAIKKESNRHIYRGIRSVILPLLGHPVVDLPGDINGRCRLVVGGGDGAVECTFFGGFTVNAAGIDANRQT